MCALCRPHAALSLSLGLLQGHAVTIIDNLSRGNLGAVESLRKNVPDSQARLRFVEADLGRKGACAPRAPPPAHAPQSKWSACSPAAARRSTW